MHSRLGLSCNVHYCGVSNFWIRYKCHIYLWGRKIPTVNFSLSMLVSWFINLPYTINLLSRNTNKMQFCNRIYYFKVYWTCFERHTAHHQELKTVFAACSLYVHVVTGRYQSWVGKFFFPVTTWAYKPEAANTVWSSWWWAVCHSKHVEPSINFGIINSITKLHLVGISTE